jgi:hypothetical protein
MKVEKPSCPNAKSMPFDNPLQPSNKLAHFKQKVPSGFASLQPGHNSSFHIRTGEKRSETLAAAVVAAALQLSNKSLQTFFAGSSQQTYIITILVGLRRVQLIKALNKDNV